MSLQSKFKRVSKRSPCAVCGKPDWCMTAFGSGGTPTASLCKRTTSGAKWGEAGFLHVHDGDEWRSAHRDLGYVAEIRTPRSFHTSAERCHEHALRDGTLHRASGDLGVSVDALERLQCGSWNNALTFPMRDETMDVVGVRTRWANGSKKSFKGSRNALFIPRRTGFDEVVYVVEGPTDTAAILSWGLPAIGRPSCQAGDSTLRAVLRAMRPQRVVFVSDQDRSGIDGAMAAANRVRIVVPDVRIIRPPKDVPDARAWLQTGASVQDVRGAAAEAPRIGVDVVGGRDQ